MATKRKGWQASKGHRKIVRCKQAGTEPCVRGFRADFFYRGDGGSVKSFMKRYEKRSRWTITGDDYGLRGEGSQSSIVIVARNRPPK